MLALSRWLASAVLYGCFLVSVDFKAAHAVEIDPGSLECPCIEEGAQDWNVLVAVLRNDSDLPQDYGLRGCNAYDEGLALTGCNVRKPPAYCAARWCYVDTTKCSRNKEACLDQGKLLNDPSHFSCRERSSQSSSVIDPDANAYYSYETCGFLNSYDTSHLQKMVDDSVLIGVATDDVPYVSIQTVPGPNPGETILEYAGVEYNFLERALDSFEPDLPLHMVPGWATDSSREKFSSSYTACVHDVAVGNFDVCIGDFWVTSERMLMTMFLPAVRTDTFHLLVFEQQRGVTFSSMMESPFQPFSERAWALIFGIVLFMGLAMAVLDFGEDADVRQLPYHERAFQAGYLAWVSVFQGKSNFRGASVPAQISTMAFQIFLLIIVASYKANLATMLIVQHVTTQVDSIYGAIDHGLTICIPTAINSTMHLNYPTARYHVYGGSSQDFARHMHAGLCQAAVIHDKRVEQLYAGWIHDTDCKAVARGDVTEEEGRCETGHLGEPRNDCEIVRVGDVLLSISVAFPVRSSWEMVAPLSWAITQAKNAGEWEYAVKTNRHLFPESKCTASDFQNGERLGEEYFAGAAILVACAVTVALCVRRFDDRNRDKDKGQGGGEDGDDIGIVPLEGEVPPHHLHPGPLDYAHEKMRRLSAEGAESGLWQGVELRRRRRLSNAGSHEHESHGVRAASPRGRNMPMAAEEGGPSAAAIMDKLNEVAELLRRQDDSNQNQYHPKHALLGPVTLGNGTAGKEVVADEGVQMSRAETTVAAPAFDVDTVPANGLTET